jgi:hypothetical protein
MLFDVRYSRKPETFEVIYWNPLTKQLELKYEEPIIDIWFLKEEYRTNKYQISQAEMEKCYPVYCKPSQVSKMIALHAGRTPVYNNDSMTYKEYYDQYVDQIKTNDMASVMCTNPYVFKADFTPDVYFRLRWLKKFGAEIDASNVTFGLVDIETDVLDRPLDIADIHSAPQPINAVSIILPHVKIMALLVLGPRPKSQIHERFHSLLENQMNEYNWLINNIDALLEELKEIAGELNGQILSNCPHKDINCIIGQLKGFYYNLNYNNLLLNYTLAFVVPPFNSAICFSKSELINFCVAFSLRS